MWSVKKSFPHMFCLLSIRSYEACMIMYARALYRSFKVKWIGKVSFPTHVLFIINTVIRGVHDNVRTGVISQFQSEVDWKSLFSHTRFVYYQYCHTRRA